MEVILASTSPRRKELLTVYGFPFKVVPSGYEEPSAPTIPISVPDYVKDLAYQKAAEVAGRSSNCLVIGADTLVCDDNEFSSVFGKPEDADDAAKMLRWLSGRTHRVYTGVSVIQVGETGAERACITDAVVTRVTFRALSEKHIQRYISTDEPFDKAGSYGAQGYAAQFIDRIEGDYFNVVGLPLSRLGMMLESLGFDW